VRIALTLCVDAHGFRNGGSSAAICLGVYKKGGKRLRYSYVGDKVLITPYANADEVTAADDLDPADDPYTLFPFADVTDKTLEAVITVVSSEPLLDTDGFVLRRIPLSVPAE
jgi:hypothetical protein